MTRLKPFARGRSLLARNVAVSAAWLILAYCETFGAQPSWWTSQTVPTTTGTASAIIVGGSAADFAAANQGQLKQAATAAFEYLSANLPGGVGDMTAPNGTGYRLSSLINGWSTSQNGVRTPITNANTADFRPINLGQLKAVALPFYDRLLTVGYSSGPLSTGTYPWIGLNPSDYSVANIGQLKYLFSFDVTYKSDPNNPLPDWWQLHYFGALGIDPNASVSWSGGSITNLQAFQQGMNPVDFYGGIAPAVAILGGNNQIGPPGIFLPQGLTIEVTGAGNSPLVDGPVRFSVPPGEGFLGTTSTAILGTSISLLTGTDGKATVYYQPSSSYGLANQIQVSAGLSSSFFIETPTEGNLSSPWLQTDVGAVGWAGSGSLNSGTFSVTGGGADIWGIQDAFHYVYQPINTDQTIIARVVGMAVTPDPWTKVGLMIRESLDPGARQAMVLLSGDNGAALEWRSNPSASSTLTNGNSIANAPYWIKLARAGSLFAAYQSPDGVNWTQIGTCSVPMGSSCYVGLAVTSHNNGASALSLFDSAQITSDSDGIGIPDDWQLLYFNQIGINPNALAPRGNGLTNLQCYQQGLSPLASYNGVSPGVSIVAGNNQTGPPGIFLPQGLTVQVSNPSDNPMTSVPVTLKVMPGGGFLGTTSTVVQGTELTVLTGTNGQATLYYQPSSSYGVGDRIQVSAGLSTASFNETSIEGTLASPWAQTDVGNVGWAGSGNLSGGAFTLTGAGADIYGTQDGFHYVYQPITSDETIVAHVAAISVAPDPWTKAGIMIRENLNPNSRQAAVLLSRDNGGSLDWRSSSGGTTRITSGSPPSSAPYWIKLVRAGSLFAGYQSSDGANWNQIGTCSVPMTSSTCYIGMAVTSHNTAAAALAVFDSIQVTTDSEGVGIPDDWQQVYFNEIGINPSALAPSGDGLTNLECYLENISPLYYNSGAADTYFCSGTNFASTSGTWTSLDGHSEIDLGRHGTISYNFAVPSSGIWELQIAAAPTGVFKGLNISIPLDILVDGVRLGHYTLNSFDGAVCDISDLTQRLQAGTHTIEVVDRNYSGISSLQIDSVAILPPQGPIDQATGLPLQLEAENTINSMPATSYVSPVCVEGKARFPEMVTLTSGSATESALSGINGQWYSNAPLNADGTTTSIVTSLESGLITGTNAVSWNALNVLGASGTTMAIRAGDGLRLTGYPVGSQPSGPVAITVTSGTNLVFTGTTTADVPLAYTFATSGTYAVQVDWNGALEASLTVQAESATYGNPLFAYLDNAETLSTPGVGSGLTVNWDSSLFVTENTPPQGGGRSFQVMPLVTGTLYGVARLAPAGPILARCEVDSYGDYSATKTGDTKIASKNPDGSAVVQSSIVLDSLPPGGYVVLQIFVAGTTFLDGSTTKTLTAADFKNGVATYEMNWLGGSTSVCHHAYIYDGHGNFLGQLL